MIKNMRIATTAFIRHKNLLVTINWQSRTRIKQTKHDYTNQTHKLLI